MNRRTFSQLKATAKNILSDNYWNSFAVFLLYFVILNAAAFIVSFFLIVPLAFGITSMTAASLYSESAEIVSALMTLMIFAFTYIAMIPAYLFVQYPMSVGLTRFFLKDTNRCSSISDLFFAYKNRLGNVILISFLKSLYIFLWSLLFCIPGIIKAYQYSMIEYILAENPAIDRKKAFEISKAMTKGNKFRIFLFGLSFIGWILLSALTFGIGYFFLYPYIYASMTQLYIDLREDALAKDTVTLADLTY